MKDTPLAVFLICTAILIFLFTRDWEEDAGLDGDEESLQDFYHNLDQVEEPEYYE